MSLNTVLNDLPILKRVLVEHNILVELEAMGYPNLEYDEREQQLTATISNSYNDYHISPTIDGVDITKYLKQDLAEYHHQLGILRTRNIIEGTFEEDRRSKEAMLHMAHMAGGYAGRDILIGGKLRLNTDDPATKSIIGSLVYRAACPSDRSPVTKEEQRLLLDNVDFSTYYIKPPLWKDDELSALLDRAKMIIGQYGMDGVKYSARRLADIGYDNLSVGVSELLVALVDIADRTR